MRRAKVTRVEVTEYIKALKEQKAGIFCKEATLSNNAAIEVLWSGLAKLGAEATGDAIASFLSTYQSVPAMSATAAAISAPTAVGAADGAAEPPGAQGSQGSPAATGSAAQQVWLQALEHCASGLGISKLTSAASLRQGLGSLLRQPGLLRQERWDLSRSPYTLRTTTAPTSHLGLGCHLQSYGKVQKLIVALVPPSFSCKLPGLSHNFAGEIRDRGMK